MKATLITRPITAEEARETLEGMALANKKLTPEVIDELVGAPVTYARAMRPTVDLHREQEQQLNEYVAVLESAFMAAKALTARNANSWHLLARKFGPDIPYDFEVIALGQILEAAQQQLAHVTPPPPAGKSNALSQRAVADQHAVRLIADICTKHGIRLGAGPESAFYNIVRAVLGRASRETIAAALANRTKFSP